MATTFDFTIVDTTLPGVSQVVPQNEDAFSYLVEETQLTVFQDGSTVLFDDDFNVLVTSSPTLSMHTCAAPTSDWNNNL